MFILKSSQDYPDDLAILSKSRGVLEEFILSLYEEDAYDWFCTLNELEDPSLSTRKHLISLAYDRAKNDSKLLTISNAVELKF